MAEWEGARRALLRTVVAAVVVLALVVVAIAWYFAGQLTSPPTVRPFEPDNEILAATDETVVVTAVADDDTFDVPVLLFHGDADDFVPPEPSRELAQLDEDVTHVPVPAAGHVRSWNVDPQRYEEALVGFLGEVAP